MERFVYWIRRIMKHKWSVEAFVVLADIIETAKATWEI